MKTHQAKAAMLLSLTQMSEFFSYFGVRTLLILYMVEKLFYSDTKAFGINAVFCSLVELGGIFGGIIADKFLGLKRSVVLGACLLALAHLILLLDGQIFIPMGLLILGASLFSSNITGLLSLLYKENDPNREKGFTVFYMMQNLGALIATLLCGFIAGQYGFRLAFAVASLGIILGNILLFFNRDLLLGLGEMPKKKCSPFIVIPYFFIVFAIGSFGVFYEKTVLKILPWTACMILIYFGRSLFQDVRFSRNQLVQFFIYLGALILFFAVEDQICSSLILFSERVVQRSLGGWMVPSSFIASLNPILIVVFGAVVMKKKIQMVVPFLLTGAVFGALCFFCLAKVHLSIFAVMGAVLTISLAELMIGPLVLSFASKIADKGSPGMVMGMVPIAFSLAFQLSGGLSKMVAIDSGSSSLEVYGMGFGGMALLMILGAAMLQLLKRRLV